MTTVAIKATPIGKTGGTAETLEETFRAEELDGLRLATRGRIISLSAVAALLFFLAPPPEVYFYHARSSCSY